MRHINKALKKNEVISYRSKTHTFYCVLGVSIFFLGLYGLNWAYPIFSPDVSIMVSNGILAVGLVIMLRSFINKQTTCLIVTNSRIMTSTGVFKKKLVQIEFKDIKRVAVKQNFLQKIINLGAIVIETKDQNLQVKCIRDPQLFIDRLKEQAIWTIRIENDLKKREKNQISPKQMA